jgi:hypothetical protein
MDIRYDDVAVNEAAIGLECQVLRRSGSFALGVTADIARTLQIGHS